MPRFLFTMSLLALTTTLFTGCREDEEKEFGRSAVAIDAVPAEVMAAAKERDCTEGDASATRGPTSPKKARKAFIPTRFARRSQPWAVKKAKPAKSASASTARSSKKNKPSQRYFRLVCQQTGNGPCHHFSSSRFA